MGQSEPAYDQKLWAIYQQTWFHMAKFSALPPVGAIVTACNPEGKILSQVDNDALTHQLYHYLDQQGTSYYRVTGMSRDHQHQEAGALVLCSDDDAKALCHRLRQNAYYWLEHGIIWLKPALHPGPVVKLGVFAERLITGELE